MYICYERNSILHSSLGRRFEPRHICVHDILTSLFYVDEITYLYTYLDVALDYAIRNIGPWSFASLLRSFL